MCFRAVTAVDVDEALCQASHFNYGQVRSYLFLKLRQRHVLGDETELCSYERSAPFKSVEEDFSILCFANISPFHKKCVNLGFNPFPYSLIFFLPVCVHMFSNSECCYSKRIQNVDTKIVLVRSSLSFLLYVGLETFCC